MESAILSDAEVDSLIYQAVLNAGPNGIEQHELEALITWAESARLDEIILRQVLAGELHVRVLVGGEPIVSLRRTM